jgi:hypothetical protein
MAGARTATAVRGWCNTPCDEQPVVEGRRVLRPRRRAASTHTDAGRSRRPGRRCRRPPGAGGGSPSSSVSSTRARRESATIPPPTPRCHRARLAQHGEGANGHASSASTAARSRRGGGMRSEHAAMGRRTGSRSSMAWRTRGLGHRSPGGRERIARAPMPVSSVADRSPCSQVVQPPGALRSHERRHHRPGRTAASRCGRSTIIVLGVVLGAGLERRSAAVPLIGQVSPPARPSQVALGRRRHDRGAGPGGQAQRHHAARVRGGVAA